MPERSSIFAVSFTETLEDFEEIYELAVREAKQRRRFSRRLLELSYQLSPLIVVLLLLAMFMGQTPLEAVVITLISISFVGLLAVLSGTGLTRKGLPSSLRRELSKLYDGKQCYIHELVISPEKFVSQCPCGIDERYWPAFEAWYETDLQFLLKTRVGCYYSIAKRAISQEDYPHLQGLLVSKMGNPIKIEKGKGPRELM